MKILMSTKCFNGPTTNVNLHTPFRLASFGDGHGLRNRTSNVDVLASSRNVEQFP